MTCDDQSGAAYGLCVAYCEAMDCDSDNPQASDIACERVSNNYLNITGSVPPCVFTDMIVFVTSTIYDGNLGGLAGADLKCQTQAVAAGLSGEYKAWLSDSNINAANRLSHSTFPYVTVDGTLIADNWDDLVAVGGTIQGPLDVTEFGDVVSATGSGGDVSGATWTATNYVGALYDGTCGDWTDSAGGSAMVGNPVETDRQWTEALTWNFDPGYIPAQLCSSLQRLYCFQQ